MAVITPVYAGKRVKHVKIHKTAVQVWLEDGCTIYSTTTQRAREEAR